MPSSFHLDLQALVIALALIAPRVLVCLTILPGLGLSVLTGMAKRAAALAIALPAVVPTFYAVRMQPPDLVLGIALAGKEAMIGLLLGTLMSIPFWVLQSIGAVFDNQRAAIPTPASNSAVDRDANTVGAALIQAAVIVMVQAGLFVTLIRILIESYGAWPAHALAPPFEPGQFDVVLRRFGDLFVHIVVYGAPVILPLLLIEFGFALIGVFAQNLQVTFASAPVKTLVGLFILLVYWPTLFHHIAGDFTRLLELAPSLMQAAPRP
ncbi:MAG TPA: type III secretion system export apparatus subunit SctT [Noviherbaspirillum sp.]|jgi:type III secretion protein T|uniref:type III secretion system export apparatus subunit SctT n=1 Tax=Noviherbaspirillum sp. TaxID=1926288 RepID=UPI002F937AB7